MYNSYKIPYFLLKFVRPYLIYLEEWQITEYWKSHLNNADFLTFQNGILQTTSSILNVDKVDIDNKC